MGSTAAELAREIHRRVRLPGPPYCMETLARALGYRVEWVPPSQMGSAVGFCWGRSIFVTRSPTPGRNRWTLAHELAHLEADAAGIPHGERFVDRCAAELLMPRRLIHAAVGERPDLPRIAQAFGASLEATGRRLIEVRRALLVLIDPSRRRTYASPLGAPPPPVRAKAIRLSSRAAQAKRVHLAQLDSWQIGAWVSPRGGRTVGVAIDPT